MQVAVTGAAGLLGRRVVARLCAQGHLAGPDGAPARIDRIVTSDIGGIDAATDPRIVPEQGDLADPDFLARAIPTGTDAIFHLAAIVSSQAEEDFELGMRGQLRCDACAARACPSDGSAVTSRHDEFRRGVRRRSAAGRAGRTGLGTAELLWHAKGAGRPAAVGLCAARLCRCPVAPHAHGRRQAGEAEPRRLVLRERHHPGAAGRGGSRLSGGSRDADLADFARPCRRQHHPWT